MRLSQRARPICALLTIAVDSPAGGGTTFRVALPRVKGLR